MLHRISGGAAVLDGVLSTGEGIKKAVRLSLMLRVGKPLRAVLAAAFYYGPLITAVLAFPISGLYLLVIGFSIPLLYRQFLFAHRDCIIEEIEEEAKPSDE